MSDGALRISILGDASQFTKTLSQLEADLKDFQEKLKTATGVEIPKLNLQILGAETSIKQITEFGKFAEGSLGFYQQLKKELEGQLLVTTNRSEQEDLNKRLVNTLSIIKEIKSAGIEKPIPVPIVIEPPPTGSIADIKRQISETVKEKEIAIGVNLTNANVKLQGLRNELSVLEKQGIEIESKPVPPVLENSIQGIKNQIDELNRKKVLIDIANEGEIAQINQDLDGLVTKLARANSISFDKNGAITANAGKSRQALTSLSLVAQDLPFGFIAIQNNLPAVISSFGALSASSNGIKGTLAALGAGLVGPAGLFLAFSVVTGAVTYAIQKYGSLGAALKEFIGTTTQLDIVLKKSTDSLEKYNKELETTDEITGRGRAKASGEIIRIQTLASAVRNVTLSEEQRANALKELQKLDPENLKNINLQKDGYGDLDKFVKKYTDSLIANAVAQEYLSKVVATTTQINQQSLALQEISKGYADIAQRRREAEAQPQFDPATGADLTTTILGGLEKAQQNLNEQFFAQAKIVSNLYSELNTYKSSLESATLETLNFFKSTKKSNEGLNEGTNKIKGLKEELQGVIPLFDLLLPSKEQFNFDFLKDFFGPNFIKQLKESQRVLNGTQSVLKKFREESGQPNLPNAEPIFRPSAEYNQKLFDEKKLAKDFEDTKAILEEVFFAPLSDLFQNFFDTGKFAFEEFGKSILNTIKSIVSKIIATGIINLLANILLPGGGIASASLNGTATGAGGGIFGAFKAAFNSILGIGKIANPNFGGVQGGGMQLAGEVVFRQRGSDLIGVINRTNGTINRVG